MKVTISEKHKHQNNLKLQPLLGFSLETEFVDILVFTGKFKNAM